MCGIQIAKIKETENVAIDDTTREQNGQSSGGQYKTKWFRLTERSGNQLAGESNWRNLPNVAQYIFCDVPTNCGLITSKMPRSGTLTLCTLRLTSNT